MSLAGANVIVRVRTTAGGGAFTDIDCNNFSISDGNEVLDGSSFNNASGSPLRSAREKFKGIEHFTLTIDADLVPSDGGQTILRDGKDSGEELQVEILYDGLAGDRLPVKVFGYDRNAAVDGKVEASFSMEGNGLVTAAV